MKHIYVAGPFRASTPEGVAANVAAAGKVALAIWRLGHVAICPHMNTATFDKLAPDRAFLDGTLSMMLRCDAVVFLPTWILSTGSRGELLLASKKKIPTFFSERVSDRPEDLPSDLIQWLNGT
jgi:hypothetical protein